MILIDYLHNLHPPFFNLSIIFLLFLTLFLFNQKLFLEFFGENLIINEIQWPIAKLYCQNIQKIFSMKIYVK